ncbi:hypothetical protein J2W22_002868 [Sphingomonas kyeonggiensis]|uniref:hypothetical protein n=1 Tax=Sphingomonas kyeonggiensis TaxID=1268553 RepID=UPI00278A85F1|nr:hypothetical protein [Sphingomonas kyeonggiensis]MDQ0250804.1 hypothetical protein [Sphingomonas kyeonggiensis]
MPKALIFGCVSLFLEDEEFLVDWEGLKPDALQSLAHEGAPGHVDVFTKMLSNMSRRLSGV